MHFCGGQYENHIGGRFLQRLQQGVKGAYGKHMDLVDDIYPVTSLCGRILHLLPYITYVLHAVVGGGIDFHHIHGGTCLDGPAGGTFVAGTSVCRMFAVHCPGKYLGYTGLTRSPGTAEQVSMADSLRRYLVFQCLHNRVLAFYILKGNRTPFAV